MKRRSTVHYFSQHTRRLVSTVWAHFVYDEYLPPILGRTILEQFNLNSDATYSIFSPFYDASLKRSEFCFCLFFIAYDNTIDTSVINAFASAAFRFGHAEVTSEMPFQSHNRAIPPVTRNIAVVSFLLEIP